MMLDCAITGGAVPAVPPYGDVGPFEATVSAHPFLHCWDCGTRLWQGGTTAGAAILACRRCQRVADERRVA